MKSLLIADTTREERERIVAESIGNIEAACDGCMAGLAGFCRGNLDADRLKGFMIATWAPCWPAGTLGRAEFDAIEQVSAV